MSAQFAWTTLHVGDIDKSLAFYRDILGFPIIERYINVVNEDIAILGHENGGRIELVELKGFQLDMTEQENISMGFEVEDAKAIFDQMGVSEYEGPIEPAPGLTYYFTVDPDGYRIQFVERS